MFILVCLVGLAAQHAGILDIYLRGQKAYGDIAAAATEHSCVAEASRDMLAMCKKILLGSTQSTEGETLQKVLALRLTNCYLEMAGMPTINCTLESTGSGFFRLSRSRAMERAVAECLQRLGAQGSGAAFQVFVQQLSRVFDVCMYLDAKDFQRQSTEASDRLLESAKDASTVMTSIVDTVQGSHKMLNSYAALLNTISQNLTLIESTAREDKKRILQALTAIRQGMAEGERELSDLMLHTALVQEQVLQRFDYSVTTLYSRLDTVNDQLQVLGESAQQLTVNVSRIAAQLDDVEENTEALSHKLQTLSETVEQSKSTLEASQKTSQEVLTNTKLAMDSIEQQAKRQAHTLTSINSAVRSISSGLGGVGSAEDGRPGSWLWRLGPFQLLWRLEKIAPGGIVWYLFLHTCIQTLITLCASSRRAVTGKRVALLVVLLSYGLELVINVTLNRVLTIMWINVVGSIVSVVGRLSEALRVRRITKLIAAFCGEGQPCHQAYEGRARIRPGMGAAEIFYGFVYGLWEEDYVQLLRQESSERIQAGDDPHTMFLQYAHSVAKFSISPRAVSAVVRLVSAASLLLYVMATVLQVLRLDVSPVLSDTIVTGDTARSRKSVRFSEAVEIDTRNATDVRACSLEALSTSKEGRPRASRRQYEQTLKKHARTNSLVL